MADASVGPRPRATRAVAIWLYVMAALVAGMVLVGGATRLTDSGLSITEWAPVSGALPPMTESRWLEEFEKYKKIPEYEQVNWGMSLEEFKRIYWWEWGHRLYGRMLGFAFLLPLIFFAATGRIDRRLGGRLMLLFALGGLQGLVGWWMVASGLTERVDVSQYRLAAHLGLAVLLFGALLWTAHDLTPAARLRVGRPPGRGLMLGAAALAAGVYLQVILGAFVAGLRAGKTFNTWPLMNGRFVPYGYFSDGPSVNDLFETMGAVQFNHRLGAYALLAGALAFFLSARRTPLERRAGLVLAFVVLQASLGIWTVLSATPIGLAIAHQAGALGLFAAAVFCVHGSRGSISSLTPSSSTG